MQLKKSTIDRYRRKWIAVLKDPSSKKAKNTLQRGASKHRCCLGHACVALGLKPDYSAGGKTYYDGEESYLPHSVAMRLGIDCSGTFKNPININAMTFSCLVGVNDETNLRPAEIAEIIRENFKLDNFNTL